MSVISGLPLNRVPSTVDFYREFGFGAVKIEDETPDNMLAPKFVSAKLSVAEVSPENVFCVGRTLPKIPSVKGEEVIPHEGFVLCEDGLREEGCSLDDK